MCVYVYIYILLIKTYCQKLWCILKVDTLVYTFNYNVSWIYSLSLQPPSFL